MKQVKNILMLVLALLALGCSQTIIFEDSHTPTPTPTPNDKQFTSAPYAVGDYYYDGTKEGVVFDVWDNGNSGKIVSMTKSASTIQWSSDLTEQNRLIGANSETDGAVNMAVVKAIPGWETKYPAFKWCADLGGEWYLPAKEELLTIYNGKDKLNTRLTDELLSESYWSSTECDQLTSGEYCAWGVSMYNSSTESTYKRYYKSVRAVATFGNAPKPEDKQLTSAPYSVGDYYNDGTKEGVVFEIWDNGNSGKILSMTKSASTIQWASDLTEQNHLVGANSETDGAVNMAVVKAISGWQSKFPAFKWCSDLGEEWYLPAKEELLAIYKNKYMLDSNLADKLANNWYWSSTEYDYQYSSGEFCAWNVCMVDGSTDDDNMYSRNYVRAVAAF